MDFVEGLSAALVPIIALTTAYIAIQQYLLNKRRLNHELYDRRLSVYRSINAYIATVLLKGSAQLGDAISLSSECAETSFLFDDTIDQYIEALWKKGIRLAELCESLEGNDRYPVGEDRNKAVEQKAELIGWFHAESEQLKLRFRKYLAV